MSENIKNLSIRNYKSIKNIDLECSRINILVGKPNVGKSNILEALSIPTAFNGTKLSDLIRFEYLSNLFYDQDLEEKIVIETNLLKNEITYDFENDTYPTESSSNQLRDPVLYNLKGNLRDRDLEKLKNPKTYIFKPFESKNAVRGNGGLKAPFGENLITILQTNRALRKEIAQYFKEYGLELVLDVHNQAIEIQKKIDDIVYQLPYNLVADTLQRIVFHLAAIESNKDAILIFEEPENHSFPPYIRTLANKIVASETNQFFISTHSPYLIQTVLQEADLSEVSVFITDFKDYETVVKKLEKEQLREVLDYGIDLFFNLDSFNDA